MYIARVCTNLCTNLTVCSAVQCLSMLSISILVPGTRSTTCHHRGYDAIDTCIDSTSVWQISIAKAAHRVFQSVKQSEEFSSILSVLCACCVFKCSCSRGPKCCDSASGSAVSRFGEILFLLSNTRSSESYHPH